METINTQAQEYLIETPILNYSDASIQALIDARNWRNLSEYERIGAAYNFVRDEIAFGYNVTDALSASEVLRDGYGQCNTKTTLCMALLRALGIPTRFRGLTIHKELQKGAVTGVWYYLAPAEIIHSWAEVWYDGQWVYLEGFILDMPYLSALQKKFADCNGNFCGYGVDTNDFKNPPVLWKGEDTYIQHKGIKRDFGVFDAPDDFYRKHGTNFKGLRKLLFTAVIRHAMNRNVQRIRG
jgi:hypothetical protein